MKLNNIKKSFDQREIKPSQEAWERLSERLDEDKSSGQRPLIYWLSAVAAIILIALLVTPFLQTQMSRDTLSNEVVVEESPKPHLIEEKEGLPSDQSTRDQEALGVTSEPPLEDSKDHLQTSKQQPRVVTAQMPSSAIATAQVTQEQSIKNQTKVPVGSDSKNKAIEKNAEIELMQSLVDTEMAMANAQKLPAKALTPEEEAALLLNQALEKETQASVASRKINPDQLLRETEWDIEADRRNQLNHAIFDGLGRLKAEAYTLITKKE